MKLLVIGGSAGGASTAARVRRLNEEAEITIFEKGRDVSFSNCSLPYYTGGVVESSEDLIMMFPEDFKAKHNIDVYTQTEVLKINRAEKTITVKDLKNGETRNEAYDKLVLATGTEPVMPGSIEGIHSLHVFTIRNVVDIERLQAKLDEESIKKHCSSRRGIYRCGSCRELKKNRKRSYPDRRHEANIGILRL